MNVNSGKRVAIAVEGYTGTAGFTEADGKASISFPSPTGFTLRNALSAGATIKVDGRSWIVEKVGPSQFLRGFKLVELRPAEGA